MDNQSNQEAIASETHDDHPAASPQESEGGQRRGSTPINGPAGKPRECHPLANVFPLLEGEEFDSLKPDIEQNGLRDAIITTPDGLILDGRNRYRACLAANVEPRFEVVQEPPENWLSLLISKNLKRRHLTASQRAAMAAELVNIKHGDNQHSSGPENFPVLNQSDAAALFGVSDRLVRDAVKVLEENKELHLFVKAGKVAVDVAARMVRHEPKNIHKFVEEMEAGKASAKAKLRIEARRRSQ